MKHQVHTLSGALLDSAVAKAEGLSFTIEPRRVWGDGSGITIVKDEPVCVVEAEFFDPSTRWAQGGPIIEREGIELHCIDRNGRRMSEWMARAVGKPLPLWFGPTPLIAIMRAYVASRLGPEVDLP